MYSRFYIDQIMHRIQQCNAFFQTSRTGVELRSCILILKIYKSEKNIKWIHWYPLCNHSFRKSMNLAHQCCNFATEKGTLFLSVSIGSILRKVQSILITPVSMDTHWHYVFIKNECPFKTICVECYINHPRLLCGFFFSFL